MHAQFSYVGKQAHSHTHAHPHTRTLLCQVQAREMRFPHPFLSRKKKKVAFSVPNISMKTKDKETYSKVLTFMQILA